MSGRRRRRARRSVTLAAALVAVLAAPAATAPLDPEQLTLRLPDVGPSYELGSSRCSERSPAEGEWWPTSLPGLSARFPHHGCVMAFGESWRTPTAQPLPRYVVSAAFSFADATGPEAALRRPRSVAARILDGDRRDLTPVTVGATAGDELRALRFDGFPGPGIVVLWRSGPVLAFTLTVGRANHRTTRAALALVAAQQARIATPTPIAPADFDDVEVPLDNPRLNVPVRWLGRRLPAHGSFPALRLLAVDGPSLSHASLEPRAAMEYGTRGGADYVDLSLWKPRRIRRELHAPLRGFCAHRFDAGVEGVRATIISYVDPATPHCAGRRPDVYTAFALFRRVAVTIETGACYGCKRKAIFGLPAGLRAIIRALRARP